MCNVCGIVSEKFRPQSNYWRKMCEYITNNKAIAANGCFASGTGDSCYKNVSGCECFAIVDGKIHNVNVLRQKLALKGNVFETDNVAELALLCYFLLGESCFKLFKGEFCIIIWDGCKKELIMLRDKVGINTLFYYFDGLRLVFSSQIKGIFQFPFVRKELCDDIYCKLFALSGSRSCGETLFLNIYEIPPGCYVKYKDLNVEVKSYHFFCIKDDVDSYEHTVSGFEYLCKHRNEFDYVRERTLTRQQLMDNIEKFIEISDFPTPYIDLKTLSNFGAEEVIYDLTGIFNAPHRFRLPSLWCKKQDKDFLNDFLSTLPWFEFKDERDISKKEIVYIKQYIVIPQVVQAKRWACKNMVFPYLAEDVAGYCLQSLKYTKKLSRQFGYEESEKNKENFKNLKGLFYDMISDENAMAGFVDKEELLRYARLFPRPETMLYLLQVNIWLNKYV